MVIVSNERLVRGGMSRVYVASACKGIPPVAWKFADEKPGSEARLENEHHVMGLLAAARFAPCVLSPLKRAFAPDNPELHERLFFEMEWVRGVSLHGLATTCAPVPEVAASYLAREAFRAGMALQGYGLLHRDLHPGNILVTPEGGARIIDFGLTCPLTRPDNLRIENGYEPPESRRGLWHAGSDVYTLGAACTDLLFGLHAHAAALAQPETLRPPRTAFEAWLAVCTEPHPGRRFASCQEALQALPPLTRLDVRFARAWLFTRVALRKAAVSRPLH